MLASFLSHVASLFDGRVHPQTKMRTAMRLLLNGAVVLAALAYGRAVVRPITDSPRPLPVAPETETTRFGMTEDERRAIFVELVRDSERDRAEAVALFHGDEWSGEDERTNRISRRIDAMGTRRRSSVLHLILDEGIRAGWPDATGTPVRATTPPLHPRIE